MKMLKMITFLLFCACFMACESSTLTTGRWALLYNADTRGIDISKDGAILLPGVYASYRLKDKTITSKEYKNHKIKQHSIEDRSLGNGYRFEVRYSDKELPTLVHSFYVFPDSDYLLADISLESDSMVASNYMAPVNADEVPTLLGEGDNRALFVPFDNDKWVRFQSHPLTFHKLVSYEVSAVFNNENRKGLIVGSVEHDNWKTAVEMYSDKQGNLSKLLCYGGVADELTRDSKPHGVLKGKLIRSPKIMIGLFDDWRAGMETYGDANALIAPRREWNRAVPFGWNSWGALQFNITIPKLMEVSDFFKDNLQNDNFVNPDNTIVTGIDSGWNSFSEEQLSDFVKKCKANGQIAGIYWVPFTDWGKNPEAKIGDAPDYKYKDVYLYANGQPQDLDGAYAIDPTHPAIEEQMKKVSAIFKRCGFEYVKMDFMTHGAMEADKYYNPTVTTGIQAYNYGLQLLNKYFSDMYINFSISPIFPANYAQSRRIACDAWNKMKDTEYTLNALSYGWWIDRVYWFNDADHVVLKEATEGENRARVTSAVITGLFITGDDFSKDGPQEVKDRALKFLTNKDVNSLAKGVSFRPVEGNGEKSENQFYYADGISNIYYAVFNYGEQDMDINIPFERIGTDRLLITKAEDLWSGEPLDWKVPVKVPSKDVRLIRYSFK
ncbi:alpha-galactosidase [Dysgonomonas sp. GY75]|uniref:alpha-galactosidase n=1 Tax=Dysgonomonas sp. GY75 TaxID=2780419 RepID=UPI0018840AE4|nr:alpha-galactosidase [Dysgonomonas sp. GY75]MBF0648637.1 alpha-galactosidase [Dysgonomonas sp. GY75]